MRFFASWAMMSALLSVLAGCAGAQYAMSNYKGVKVETFKSTTGRTFRIFDKPTENRLMITPTVGGALGHGAAKGLTFGASGASPAVIYRDGAAEYLAAAGRSCTIKDTTLIADPQYEVRYDCAAAPAIVATEPTDIKP